MAKKTFLLILTVGLISVILGATMAWFNDIEVSQGNVFQAGVWGQPRLWIWQHGGKVWPDWQVGVWNQTQIIYARIANDGNRSAYIKVKFIVSSPYGSYPLWSSVNVVEASDPEAPTNVFANVSAEYDVPGPGQFYVKANLYFSLDNVTWRAWVEIQDVFGGQGISRTASSKFKATA